MIRHGIQKVECEHCKQVFFTKQALINHIFCSEDLWCEKHGWILVGGKPSVNSRECLKTCFLKDRISEGDVPAGS